MNAQIWLITITGYSFWNIFFLPGGGHGLNGCLGRMPVTMENGEGRSWVNQHNVSSRAYLPFKNLSNILSQISNFIVDESNGFVPWSTSHFAIGLTSPIK